MKRLLTLVAAIALAVGVSLPAAALTKADPLGWPGQPTPGAALPAEQGLAVAVAPAAVDLGGDYAAEAAPPPQPVYASGTYTGPVPDAFAGAFTLRPVPGGQLADGFGYRDGGEWHGGIDVLAPGGTPVVAVGAGTVVTVVGDPAQGWGFGTYVVIDHGEGIQTLYAHMIAGSPVVTAGQFVEAGQQIGLVGDTGYATTTHCHLEVHVNGAQTDPIPFFAPGVF